MSKEVGYARVSSSGQNLARQIEALNRYVPKEMIVIDKASGKNFDRAGYQSLKVGIGKLEKGDTLYIKSLDRLGRNKRESIEELQYFRDNGIRVKVLDIPTTMIDISDNQEWVIDMVNNILIEVLTSVAEQERRTTRERQREGIECMQYEVDEMSGKEKRKSDRTGNFVGRPALKLPYNWEIVYTQWKKGEITAKAAMELTGTKRTSFYKLVKRMEENKS